MVPTGCHLEPQLPWTSSVLLSTLSPTPLLFAGKVRVWMAAETGTPSESLSPKASGTSHPRRERPILIPNAPSSPVDTRVRVQEWF